MTTEVATKEMADDEIVQEGTCLIEFPELNSSEFHEVFQTINVTDFDTEHPSVTLNAVFPFDGFWTKSSCTPTVFRLTESTTDSGRPGQVQLVGHTTEVIIGEIKASEGDKSTFLLIPEAASEKPSAQDGLPVNQR